MLRNNNNTKNNKNVKNSTKTSSSNATEETQTDMKKLNTSDFNPKYFSIDPIKPAKDVTQYTTFCRYDYQKIKSIRGFSDKAEGTNTKDRCIILTKPIEIKRGGIPSHHEKWRPTPNDRMYFWLNLDQDEGGIDLCEKVFEPLDALCHTKIMEEGNKSGFISKGIGSDIKPETKLNFVSGVKMSMAADDDDTNLTLPQYKRIKVKLSTVYNPDAAKDDPQKIKTKVFVDSDEITINSLDDVIEQFGWTCKVELLLEINKVWVMKSAGPNGRNCGYAVKCLAMHIVEKCTKKQSTQSQINLSMFGSYNSQKTIKKGEENDDSDSDDDNDTKKTEKSTDSDDSKDPNDDKKQNESDDSDDENVKKSNVKENKKPETKQSKQKKEPEPEPEPESDSDNEPAQESSDMDSNNNSDESDDENVKSKKQVDSDDSDDSNKKKKSTKVSKTKPTKKSKGQNSDSDTDDDSVREQIKEPVKKSKAQNSDSDTDDDSVKKPVKKTTKKIVIQDKKKK
jgi:hypothetical protein